MPIQDVNLPDITSSYDMKPTPTVSRRRKTENKSRFSVVFLQTNPTLKKHNEAYLKRLSMERDTRLARHNRAQRKFFMQCAFDSEQRLRYDKERLMRISSRLQDNLEPVKSVRTTGRFTNRTSQRTSDRTANAEKTSERASHRSRLPTDHHQKPSRPLKPLTSERTLVAEPMGQLTALPTTELLDKTSTPATLPRLPGILLSTKEEGVDKSNIEKNKLPILDVPPIFPKYERSLTKNNPDDFKIRKRWTKDRCMQKRTATICLPSIKETVITKAYLQRETSNIVEDENDEETVVIEVEVAEPETVALPPLVTSSSIDLQSNPIVPRLKLGSTADSSELPTYRPNALLGRISQTLPVSLMQKLTEDPQLLARKKKLENENRLLAARDFSKDPRWKQIEKSLERQKFQ